MNIYKYVYIYIYKERDRDYSVCTIVSENEFTHYWPIEYAHTPLLSIVLLL